MIQESAASAVRRCLYAESSRLLCEAEATAAGFFVKLPPELAAQYPKDRGAGSDDNSPPHITLLYVGDMDEDDVQKLVAVGQRVFGTYAPREAFVGGLAWITNPKGQEVAHSMVSCPVLARLSRELWDECLRDGIPVKHSFPDFLPHVTLAYSDEREYNGPVPSGSFTLDRIEVWRGEGVSVGTIFANGSRK